jgi:SAM-dependent methyltransferase
MTAAPWWVEFFDTQYIELWGFTRDDARSDREAEQIAALLGLGAGQRVLDAPCGYGRLSRRLATRGLEVLGLDQSAALLERAEAERPGGVALSYRRHDLREPFSDGGFDAALNVFSSLGYGTEDDDLAILRNLVGALRPGGTLLVETAHRDTVVAARALGQSSCARFEDGTLMVEQSTFDPVRGESEMVFHFAGPRGTATKRGRIRLYCATELVRLVESAGARVEAVLGGLDGAAFSVEGRARTPRLAIVARRT